MSKPLLHVKNLAVFRGEHCVFAGLDFQLFSGEILQLHGDNGSGKTTLLRALCTLLPLEQGVIFWRGESLPGARARFFTEMIYSGHSEAIKSDLSPRENLIAGAALRGSADVDIDSILVRVGLTGKADLPCRLLSAGQRRRVTLARLLTSRTALWILDEPLTSLDMDGRSLVEKLITGHAVDGGAVIYTTHQPLNLEGCEVRSLKMGH
ncbi:heme ABC exporter, ATP-binding protein CcmA [Chromatiales bacterium (ex Bugula neritina AB1)]|nr:heme ABC exporter, ATP-binding protein CcmA [Chromatiales bacterium (ex Bugula neritina AB1)]